MSSCKKCKGVCRCEHEYAICLTAEAENLVKTKCPIDMTTGCIVETVDSSLLEVFCPACPVKVLEFTDPFDLRNCDPCHLMLDLRNLDGILLAGLTSADLRTSVCTLRYRLTVNDRPYLAGQLTIDWSFA